MMTTKARTRIVLAGLRFHAFHGVLPQERLVGNDYRVDMDVDYDFTQALASDHLADTLNYADVYEVVEREMRKPAALLERLAGRIAESLFGEFPGITGVHLRILKLSPPIGADCEGAGVDIYLNK